MKSEEAIRRLIQDRLTSGDLPVDACAKVLGGVSNGETCDGRGDVVVGTELVMECIGDHSPRAFLFHVLCFYIWDAARRR